MYKVTNLNELKTFTTQTADALEMPVDPNDPADIIGKINLLTMLLGASCQAVALAQRIFDRKMLDLMTERKYAAFPPYEKKLTFDGFARVESFYVKLTESQNSAIKYVLHNLDVMLQALNKY
jgi:hypothetical protein